MDCVVRVTDERKKGFTLLETLIVIAVIAILSAILIFIFNPAETLRKSRDAARVSDLKTLSRAIAFFITTKTNIPGDALCGGGALKPKLYVSFPKDKKGVDISGGNCPTLLPPPGSPLSGLIPNWHQVLTDDSYRIDGFGWFPVNFASIPGGSPISRLPVDPVNSINIPVDIEGDDCVDDDDLVYRYTCFQTNLTFEFDAKLESREFNVTRNIAEQDGGTNIIRFEAGTALNLLP